jgi:hypothetical protein
MSHWLFTFLKVIIDSPRGFCLGISDMCISHFNHINPQ